MNTEKIYECEKAYTELFSTKFEDSYRIRYRDDLISDMYDHNYTKIKDIKNDSTMNKIILEEIKHSLSEHKNYCNIYFDGKIELNFLEPIDYKYEISTYAIYATTDPSSLNLDGNINCKVARIKDNENLEYRANFEIAEYFKSYGEDFCLRKNKRLAPLFLNSSIFSTYLCTNKGAVLGKCDLFLYENIAKIEDFDVALDSQRKGYGTSIIKKLVTDAVDRDINIIYMTTDYHDTAKEMYLKLGFKEVGFKTQLFINLEHS